MLFVIWNLADVFREIGASARIIRDSRQQLLGPLCGRFSEEAPLLRCFVNDTNRKLSATVHDFLEQSCTVAESLL